MLRASETFALLLPTLMRHRPAVRCNFSPVLQTLAARRHTWDEFSAKWVAPGTLRGPETPNITQRMYTHHSNTGIHRSMAQSMKPTLH